MIKKILKNPSKNSDKINKLLKKHNIPTSYLNANRRMISRGVGIGLFWGFIPMPMQMLAVILSMPLFRFNVPIAISMVWLSNPITMPFMYYMEYLTGNFILGLSGVENFDLSMDWVVSNFDKIILPLYVGTSFYSIVVSFLIYVAVNLIWIKIVKRKRKERRRK